MSDTFETASEEEKLQAMHAAFLHFRRQLRSGSQESERSLTRSEIWHWCNPSPYYKLRPDMAKLIQQNPYRAMADEFLRDGWAGYSGQKAAGTTLNFQRPFEGGGEIRWTFIPDERMVVEVDITQTEIQMEGPAALFLNDPENNLLQLSLPTPVDGVYQVVINTDSPESKAIVNPLYEVFFR